MSNIDVFLLIVTQEFLSSSECKNEFDLISSYAKNKRKLVIALTEPDQIEPFESFNIDRLDRITFVNFDKFDNQDYEKISAFIDSLIYKEIGKNIATQEDRSERIKRIETKASDYVDEAIVELKERELSLVTLSKFWCVTGFISIVVGFFITVAVAGWSVWHFSEDGQSWILMTFISLKGVVGLALLVILGRYSFSLGKSFMDEALKNADRVHAISFGKFYLQAFGDDSDAGDIKEVFQHWNIGGVSSFQDGSEKKVDPRVLESVRDIVAALNKD